MGYSALLHLHPRCWIACYLCHELELMRLTCKGSHALLSNLLVGDVVGHPHDQTRLVTLSSVSSFNSSHVQKHFSECEMNPVPTVAACSNDHEPRLLTPIFPDLQEHSRQQIPFLVGSVTSNFFFERGRYTTSISFGTGRNKCCKTLPRDCRSPEALIAF